MFDRDEHYRYAVLDRAGTLLGEVMLLDREQTGARELGYFMDTAQCGKGYATEASAALLQVAFDVEGVSSVELGCAEANRGSVAIAKKLGFEHLSTTERSAPLNEDDRYSMHWSLWASSYRRSLWAEMDVHALDALGRPLL